MNLTPFVEVDGTLFSMSQDDVISRLGRPPRTSKNNVELNELDYGEVVFRFQDSGRLEEVTKRTPVLHLGKVAVPFAMLDPFVKEQDPTSFERAGFVVSPAFGFAFAPQSPAWITALAKHCIPTWQSL